METRTNSVARPLLMMSVAITTVVALGLWAGYTFEHRAYMALMMVIVASIVFFGFLALPGSLDEDGAFSERRIRLAITATLLIVYLVYFGTVIFLEGELDTFAKQLLPTLTTLLSVAIPFYFGASAAVEINSARSKEKKREPSG